MAWLCMHAFQSFIDFIPCLLSMYERDVHQIIFFACTELVARGLAV